MNGLIPYLALIPEIGLVAVVFVILFVDKGLKPENKRNLGIMTAWGIGFVLLGTIAAWIFAAPSNPEIPAQFVGLMWGDLLNIDSMTFVFRVIFLSAALLVCLIAADVEGLQRAEFFALICTATIGFSLMAASSDLVMLFVALETASISAYVLAGFLTKNNRSSEAGMKYFVYGSFASALMLYGMSLLYGMTFQSNYYGIGQMIQLILNPGQFSAPAGLGDIGPGVLLVAGIMIFVGFGFKISAVPFHFWTPDVYEGSPTSVTAFISTASKAAGFAAFIRMLNAGALGPLSQEAGGWWSIIVAVAIATMTLGNLAAIYQKNLKRLFAYSSVAQAGYVLVGLLTMTPEGSGAAMYYLLMYVFTNIAAFGVLIIFSRHTGSEDVEDLKGLSRRSPALAIVMLIALLSLAGIPPTAGFIGKFLLFKAAVDNGLWWLALIGVLNAFIAIYYYLNVAKHMYLYRTDDEDEPVTVPRAAWVALTICSAAIIYLGTLVGPAIEWTTTAASTLFTG